ncbi:uncharacterized protein LOC103385114 isoform X1 [Cynoglossus semilaevis]|uniref:uncharacterized protein LOC103385114 isoform X1 n=1 Tax=Cynoglossus semilaevis TaxID=244447 RepID=UPI000D62C03F|nr:uncharacterized protein LOC103385114 isoform X1 [Cynoglossus semilaevis]
MQNRDNFKSFYVNWILRPAPLSPVVWPRLSLFHLRSAPNEPHGPGHRQQRRQTLCLGCLNSCTITERKHRQQRRLQRDFIFSCSDHRDSFERLIPRFGYICKLSAIKMQINITF